MHCPRDHHTLRSERYESDLTVDACPSCGGMWLAPGELEQIEEIKERDYSDELARMVDLGYNAYEMEKQRQLGPARCPACDVELENREYARCSQVMIDVCPNGHGVWLDRGEIEALEIFFERSRLEASTLRRLFLAGLRAMLPR